MRTSNLLSRAGTLSATFLCLAMIGIGQTSVSQEFVDRFYQKAREICRSTPYRIKITIEDRDSEDQTWKPYSQSVTEYSGPNSHFKGKNIETISIGKEAYYIKQGDGVWKKKVPQGSRATVRNVGSPVSEWVQEKIGGGASDVAAKNGSTPVTKWVQEKADGMSNRSAVTFRVETRFTLEYLSDGMIYEHHNTGRVVFDDLGRYVLTESISFEPRRRVFIRRLEEYEYDDSIRIEPPLE